MHERFSHWPPPKKKIKPKIHLIKIDVNGHELSVIKGLSKIIQRDRPAIIIETNDDIKLIENYLKKHSFEKYLFLNVFFLEQLKYSF